MLYKLNPTRKEKGRLEITGDGWRFQHGRHEEALAAGVRGAHGLRSKKPRPYVTRAYVAWYSMVWSYSCAAVRSSETSIRSIASPLLVLVVVGGGLRIFFFSFFLHTFTLQLLNQSWSKVPSLLPPGSCLQFLSRIGLSNPTARLFYIEFR